MPESTSSLISNAWTFVGVVMFVIGSIISVPLWVNKQFKTQRDEMYKRLSENKANCADVKERVKVLEIKEEASSKKLERVESKVEDIDNTLNEMKLNNKETELKILTAIGNISNRE